MARFWSMSPEEFTVLSLDRIAKYAEMTKKISDEEREAYGGGR